MSEIISYSDGTWSCDGKCNQCEWTDCCGVYEEIMSGKMTKMDYLLSGAGLNKKPIREVIYEDIVNGLQKIAQTAMHVAKNVSGLKK